MTASFFKIVVFLNNRVKLFLLRIFPIAVETPSVHSNDDTHSNSTAQSISGASKRKGSFKKWLRASHRKLTSSTVPSMTLTNPLPHKSIRAKDLNKIKQKVTIANLKAIFFTIIKKTKYFAEGFKQL